MTVLNRSLGDLDAILAPAPPPVRLAVEQELAAELEALRSDVARFRGQPATELSRGWKFESPFVYTRDLYILDRRPRVQMNDLEEGWEAGDVERAVRDVRILRAAYRVTSNSNAELDFGELNLADEPDVDDHYGLYLEVQPPLPEVSYRQSWQVMIGRWAPDDPDADKDNYTSTSTILLTCALSGPPAVLDLVLLLDLSAGSAERLAEWATTPVGTALAGTGFVVSERSDQ